MNVRGAVAEIGGGESFRASGRWAGEQLLKALKEGKPITPQALRTLDTLRKNEWEFLDKTVYAEAAIRLQGIKDLIAAGLVTNIPNAMGKTIFQWQNMTDMNPADQSLSGINRTENDRVEFNLSSVPLFITHKDFDLNIRTLAASRNNGEALDSIQARVSGRLVSESLENTLFNGTTKVFGGFPTYGYTTHPNRNTVNLTEVWDAAGKTGEEIFADVIAMVQAANDDRFFGPFHLYVPAGYGLVIDNDFKANSDISIRERLLKIDGLKKITTVDSLAEDNVILVQMTNDVVELADGEPIQTVQWDVDGGFIVKFKVFCIQVPIIRADTVGRSGVVHLRPAP